MNNLGEFLKIPAENTKKNSQDVPKREPLGTKTAIELLLSGKLKERVCKFCLYTDSNLYEFDQIFEIMGNKTVPVKITVKDMIGTIYPFEISKNPNLPNSVCNTCINRIVSCYLFAQQCDQAERALNNCIDDVYDKMNRLDPLEKPKTRGRQKVNPNTNVIYAEFDFVIDYADPLMSLISHGNIESEEKIGPLECKKCWKVFPNMEQLLNHEAIHPKSMWYSCRICGLSMPKMNTYKQHIKNAHKPTDPVENKMLCKCACGNETENYSEHLQHIEKHKFKVIMQHALDGNMDKLCSVCLQKKSSMTQLDTSIRLHGGYPEITGNQNLSNIVARALPDIFNELTSDKVCESCLDRVLTTYLLVEHTRCLRTRLNNCLEHMINNLNAIENPTNALFIEIASNLIMPKSDKDIFEKILDNNEMDIDVLEDEFRVDESEPESEQDNINNLLSNDFSFLKDNYILNDKKNFELVRHSPLVNGYDISVNVDIIKENCFEFLTFHDKNKLNSRHVSCLICGKKFISNYFLKAHVKKHINIKKRCLKCNLEFKSKFSLLEHDKKDHRISKFKFSCKYCGRNFKLESNLLYHEKIHSNFKCFFCEKSFVNYRICFSHMQKHTIRMNSVPKRNSRSCSFCEKEFDTSNDLVLHVNKVHLQIKPFSCDMCDKQFYTSNNLTSHMKVHDLPSYECCAFCSKVLKNRKHFVVHLRKHLRTKPFICPLCGKDFYCSSKKLNHMAKAHGGKFVCNQCNRVFTNERYLKYHVSVTHGTSFCL